MSYPNRFVDLQLVAVNLCSGIVVRCTAVNVEVLLSSSFEGVAAKLYFSVLKLVFGFYARWQSCEKRLLSCDTACLADTGRIFVKFYVGRLAKVADLRSGLVEIVRKYGQFTRRMLMCRRIFREGASTTRVKEPCFRKPYPVSTK